MAALTEFTAGLTASSEPSSITKGPDGALWFTETAAGMIGRITTSGDITEFSSGLSGSGEPKDIVTGPDGNLWFTLNAGQGGIGRITPDGDVTEFSYGLTMNSEPLGIAAGPDGNLWFTQSAQPAIGRITTDGHITEYFDGFASIVNPWSIVLGSSTGTCGSPGTPPGWSGASRCRRSCASSPPTRSRTRPRACAEGAAELAGHGLLLRVRPRRRRGRRVGDSKTSC